MLTLIWSSHCLPDSAWAAGNWAEIAEQMGNIVELQECSQQNIVSDHNGQPVQKFPFVCLGPRAHRRHPEGAEPPPPRQPRGQNLRRQTSIPAAAAAVAEGPRGPSGGLRRLRRLGNLAKGILIISRATSALPSIFQAREGAAKYLIAEWTLWCSWIYISSHKSLINQCRDITAFTF